MVSLISGKPIKADFAIEKLGRSKAKTRAKCRTRAAVFISTPLDKPLPLKAAILILIEREQSSWMVVIC